MATYTCTYMISGTYMGFTIFPSSQQPMGFLVYPAFVYLVGKRTVCVLWGRRVKFPRRGMMVGGFHLPSSYTLDQYMSGGLLLIHLIADPPSHSTTTLGTAPHHYWLSVM